MSQSEREPAGRSLSSVELLRHTAAAITNAAEDVRNDDPLAALDRLNAAAASIALATERIAGAAIISGASWTQVGDALGMTKQAAHQRFKHVTLVRQRKSPRV